MSKHHEVKVTSAGWCVSDAAHDWAHEHGYLEVYRRRTWCRDHRALHTFMGKPSPTFGTCFGDC